MYTGEQVKSHVCGKRFEKKAEMMTHRKLEHAEIVIPCKKHQIKQCRFQDQTCWYKHETESNDDSVPKPMNEEQKMETESVCQKVTQNLKPQANKSEYKQRLRRNIEVLASKRTKTRRAKRKSLKRYDIMLRFLGCEFCWTWV